MAEIDSAVETYKKIGLFRELDAKYEMPGGAQASAGTVGEEGGAEGGGGGGAGGGGGLGNIDLGESIGWYGSGWR
ncbi:MAG: hypothetical protein KatS3mg035_1090 [Bacteroidia bacterium]|nr:MAG: hypothetical protein KatS3mg035_1090 [Bacteroidia bacterium]